MTPSATSDDKHVQLDLRSSVTRGEEAGKSVSLQSLDPGKTGEPAVQVDRLTVSRRQFATSVPVPLRLHRCWLAGSPSPAGTRTSPASSCISL